GDPLDPSVPVRLVLSGGDIVFKGEARPGAPAVLRTKETRPELPARLPKKYALRTQRLVNADGELQPGLAEVDNQKVAGVGTGLALSDGIPTYDLGSAVLSSGLVVGHSALGLAGDIDDPAEADAGHVRAADVYDPQHRVVREMLAGGFTSALFAPGS